MSGGVRSALLVIEDGSEYADFARLFLGDAWEVRAAQTAAGALAEMASPGVAALLVDLRFERTLPEALIGDLDGTAARLFAGDRGRALRYLQDQQGTLILAELRAAGHRQLAVFIHDFPPRRLANLRQLYGAVDALPAFDAARLRAVLDQGLR